MRLIEHILWVIIELIKVIGEDFISFFLSSENASILKMLDFLSKVGLSEGRTALNFLLKYTQICILKYLSGYSKVELSEHFCALKILLMNLS